MADIDEKFLSTPAMTTQWRKDPCCKLERCRCSAGTSEQMTVQNTGRKRQIAGALFILPNNRVGILSQNHREFVFGSLISQTASLRRSAGFEHRTRQCRVSPWSRHSVPDATDLAVVDTPRTVFRTLIGGDSRQETMKTSCLHCVFSYSDAPSLS